MPHHQHIGTVTLCDVLQEGTRVLEPEGVEVEGDPMSIGTASLCSGHLQYAKYIAGLQRPLPQEPFDTCPSKELLEEA